ncbi:retrovirus-related pol polyprotein from transposon TNT 1-94 [Tanacetum coccineum]
MMSFLTAVVTSRYPTTNNQLRNSSNPRQQATSNNEKRATQIPIHGTNFYCYGTSRTYTLGASGSHFWKTNDMLAEVHNHDNMNNNVAHQAVQVMPSSQQSNVVNHSETEITSDSNIIPYSQYVIESQQATIQKSNSSAQQDDLILSSVNDTLTAELERYKEQVKVLKEGQNVDLRSKDNVSDTCAQSVEIDLLKQTLSEHLKEKESLLQTVTLLKNDFKKEESRNIDREIALEKQIKHLDNIVFKREQSAQTVFTNKAQQSKPKLYVGDIIVQTNPIVIPDSEETLALCSMLSDNPDLCVHDFSTSVEFSLLISMLLRKIQREKFGNQQKRITTTTEVPLMKSSALGNKTPKPVFTLVYSRKPRKSKTSVTVNNYKVIKSVTTNNSEPSQSWGSIVSNVPSSSLDEFRSSKLSSVATACYTQNRSMIRRRHGKTPYELLHNKPPDLSYLHVFGALCYLTNDSENLGKLQPKADIGRIKMLFDSILLIEAMQEEPLMSSNELEVWELVPRPHNVMVITLKWIYKVKLDEMGGILKNKARLVARGYRQEEGIDFEESLLHFEIRAIMIFSRASLNLKEIGGFDSCDPVEYSNVVRNPNWMRNKEGKAVDPVTTTIVMPDQLVVKNNSVALL